MAEKKVNLRTTASKVPAGMKSNTVNMPGLRGTLPFKQANNPSKNIPEEVRREIQRVNDEPIVTPEQELKKAVTPPPLVQLEDLPEEKQQDILNAIKDVTQGKPTKPKSTTPFMPRGPGIAEAKALADKVEAETVSKLKSGTKDEPIQTEKIEDKPIDPSPILCEHCNWPIGVKDTCQPDKHDKHVFTAAILGQLRFSKEYGLLGGKLKLTFRSLTVEENDLIVKQMITDWNDGKINGPAHSVAEATKYQLALALESIETGVGRITLPTLEEYDYDETEKGTVLPTIVNYVNKKAMPTEPVRRVVSKTYLHFIETQSKLEAMAETPDFWLATEV